MGRNSTITKKKRLDELVGLLKSKESWISTDLSQELGVTLRTLMRDLKDLKEMGIPIESDRGRGGGIRINRYYGLGRIDFNYSEIIDLLLALSTIEKMESPLFLQDLKSIKNKIIRAFPDGQRSVVNELRKRILIGDEASDIARSTYIKPKKKIVAALHEAFFERKQVKITYISERKEKTTRIIEPELMLLNWPIWYIVGWDRLRDDVRNFRVDRIMSCKVVEQNFKPLKHSDYGDYLHEFFKIL
jgi:predicted DNA-binding transcriptional regulator YafY